MIVSWISVTWIIFKRSAHSFVAFLYTEDKDIVGTMHFSMDNENQNRLNSVGFALILLSIMKDIRKLFFQYQFLKARIVVETVYGQKLDHRQIGYLS